MSKYQLWALLAFSFLSTPVYAQEEKKDNSFRIKSDLAISVPYNEKGSLILDLDYHYKAWTLMGEPVEHCLLKWYFPSSGFYTFTLFNPYTKKWQEVMPPQEVVLKSRLTLKDVEVDISPSTKINCDAGSLGKGGVRDLLGQPKIEADSSFNSPGSPDWNELFLYSGISPYTIKADDGRTYLNSQETKRLFKSLRGTTQEPPFWSIDYIDAKLEIGAVERWFLEQAKKNAPQKAKDAANDDNHKSSTAKSDKAKKKADKAKEENTINRADVDSSQATTATATATATALGKSSNSKSNNSRKQHVANISNVTVPSAPSNNSSMASLMLVIDTSGSMSGTRLKEAKHAAIELIKKSVSNNTEVSVMAFSGECSNPITNRHDFSLDAASLKRFVNNLRAGGGTPMSAAVEYANVYLANNKSSTSASEMILLLADGDDSCDILSPVVRELKSKGILFRHQTIGLELDRSSNAAKDLKQLAKSSGGDYATASNAKQLSQTFENAAIAMGILSLIGSYDPKHGSNQSDSSQQSIWDGFSE